MVFHAGIDPSNGVTPIEVTLLAFDGELVTDEPFVLLVGSVEPVGTADKVVPVDCIALASEPVPPPHPEPHRAQVTRRMKNRNNGKLCGCR